MKRFIILGLLLALAAPAGAACISTHAGDWDDCSERRRPGREPVAWCGGGAGSEGSSWRQRRADAEAEVAKIKASIAALFGGVLTFKPSHEID
jgi:hypothetical protein